MDHPNEAPVLRDDADEAVLRTIVLPEFTPEQVAYLDSRMAAARFRPEDDRRRVGGVFTGPWPRHAGVPIR